MEYYHMSPQLYGEGDIIKPNGKYKIDQEIEEELEKLRPQHLLSRRNAIFAHSSTDFSQSGLTYNEGYIYQVELIGDIQKHDISWLSHLQLAKLKIKYKGLGTRNYPDWTPDLIDKCANSYWNRENSDNPNWEYLASSMIIIKLLTITPVSPTSTKGGWP